MSWRDCCSGSRRLSAAGQIYDNCRYGQGQIALAWKETVSTPGGCVWTCDLISEQACPCQPEPCRHRASPAALRPGARELQGFQLLLTAVFVLLLPALSAAVVQQMAQLAVLMCMAVVGGVREQELDRLSLCRSCKPGGREMDGAAPCPCFCPSPSLLKAGCCIPASAGMFPEQLAEVDVQGEQVFHHCGDACTQ